MQRTVGFALVTFLVFSAASSLAQQAGKIEGVWEMISQKTDGKETEHPGRQWKIIAMNHWVYIAQDHKGQLDRLAKQTHEDSVAAYTQYLSAGAGSYTLKGSTYTETPEFFQNPAYLGHPIEFTMKVEGDRLYQSGKLPIYDGRKKTGEIMLEEVYKRVEQGK